MSSDTPTNAAARENDAPEHTATNAASLTATNAASLTATEYNPHPLRHPDDATTV